MPTYSLARTPLIGPTTSSGGVSTTTQSAPPTVPMFGSGGSNGAKINTTPISRVGVYSGGRSPYASPDASSQQSARPLPEGSQTWPYTQLPYAPYQQFSDDPKAMSNYESKSTSVTQAPTNVYQGGQYRIPGQLDSATASANQFAQGTYDPTLTNLGSSYNTRFQNASDLAPYLTGGVDYLGRLGMSEGASNILAQQANANRALQSSLGRNAGNRSLINVLQNQNAFRSQLAMNPLYSEAQRGSYERALGNVGLNNQALQASNAAQQSQAGFNNQNALQQFQSRMAALQPQQNLLEYLSTLQGQARGLSSSEQSLGGKNFE